LVQPFHQSGEIATTFTKGKSMLAIATQNAPAAVGPYSQAVRTGGLLFVSGQLPIDPKTGEIPDDMLDQMLLCLQNIEAIAAAGTSLAKTVKTTVLVTDLSRFSEFNEVYGTMARLSRRRSQRAPAILL
jgi:2-iminobutanoate/2-iminopropanoate deaminase